MFSEVAVGLRLIAENDFDWSGVRAIFTVAKIRISARVNVCCRRRYSQNRCEFVSAEMRYT